MENEQNIISGIGLACINLWHLFRYPPSMLRKFKYTISILTFSIFSFSNLCAQDSLKAGKYKIPSIIIGDDTVPVINLPMVTVVDFADPEILKNLQAYYRLRFNVIKMYPYAKLAAVKLKEMNDHAATLTNAREKRKYLKETEKRMKDDFEGQIKNFSISQGDVLIKLIHRETGNTSYALIKELRGSFSAFFDQSLARLFGHDLKDEYEPQGKDKTIEDIIQQIESGQITN